MDTTRTYPQPLTQDVAERQHRVLRNTYGLLALSMLPTVLGALIGIQMKMAFFAGSPFISFLLFMGYRAIRAQPAAEAGEELPPAQPGDRARFFGIGVLTNVRSEERRVGKECTSWCRSRWSPYH